MALTTREIETAKATVKPYKLTDGSGLCLLVTSSGSKLWRWRYYFQGKEKMMALGEYPLVSLKEARDLHFAARKTLGSGVDPMEERKVDAATKQEHAKTLLRRAESSVEKVARKWWDTWSTGKSPRHAAQVMRRLEADVFPVIGHKFVDDVKAADVRELVLAIEDRGARDVAKRAQETIGQIFRFAIANGLATRNPAADFKPSDILKPAMEMNFARVDESDLPELLAKMWTYKGDILTIYAMRLMAYLWVRTSELIEADWAEFELEKEKWEIPRERMKKRRPHIVPLPHQAVTILRDLSIRTGNGTKVFPGANDKDKTMSNNTILFALYRLGYKGEMTGHGFRGIASTVLYESNLFEEDWIEMQLAHVEENKVKGAYNKAKYIKQRAKMMQWWADYVDTQLAKGIAALAN
ncbi:integrase arm-type DNA-binding domain-containing protein [Terriglobus sp. TAA 43]|uniref:tyrosine-type recombinase/integrase n=1 Tax=Terriglobus sp. TAA 43 TaxID=278961 RepID=UPI0006465AE9|nr:integrase arm-type DNA-binding domain-containing protein [Terriglobus sp. TAA 43]